MWWTVQVQCWRSRRHILTLWRTLSARSWFTSNYSVKSFPRWSDVLDPITSAFNLATAIITLAGKVWDATPPAQQAAAASDWATFTHGMGEALLALQKLLPVKA